MTHPCEPEVWLGTDGVAFVGCAICHAACDISDADLRAAILELEQR